MSREGKILETLEYVEHFQEFMYYFHHCDANYFSDPEIRDSIIRLNQSKFDLGHLKCSEKNFRLAFVFNQFNDVGGASFSEPFMLEIDYALCH